MRIWDLRKKMNDIKKQIHDLSLLRFVRCQPDLPFSFHRHTTCFGWKECLTLNNKTRNNVAKWEIKGRSVKRATPDNFYCRLYGRFIFINSFYRSEFWQVTYELHFTSIQIRNVWGCASWQFVSTSFFAQTFAKDLGLAKSSWSPRILIAPIKLLMHKINLRHFFKCFKCLERLCKDFFENVLANFSRELFY